MANIDETWFVIVNPHAGSGKTIKEWTLAKWHLEGLAIPYISRHTRNGGHAIELAFEGAEKGYRHFIAVGGDGTVHEVAGGIARFVEETPGAAMEDFTIGVIPIGSGNDWIKSHNVPHDTLSVVDLMSASETALQDVVKVTDSKGSVRYMLNIGGIGLDPFVCEVVNRKKSMGQRSKLIYVIALLQCLVRFKTGHVEVVADGETVFDGNLFTMALGIGKYSGGGMRQVPDAILDDGMIDYSIVSHDDFFYIVWRVWRVFTSSFQKIEKVKSGRARLIEVRLKGGHAQKVEADGEIVAELPVRIEVLPGRINALHVK